MTTNEKSHTRVINAAFINSLDSEQRQQFETVRSQLVTLADSLNYGQQCGLSVIVERDLAQDVLTKQVPAIDDDVRQAVSSLC